MNSVEEKLNERIKELTCLYEVSSVIVNTDYDQLERSFDAIASSLKNAWRYPAVASVLIQTNDYAAEIGDWTEECVTLRSAIKVFNEVFGHIEVGYPASSYSELDFLDEEQKLLENVSRAIGNLLERKQIRDNEAAIKRQVERADRLNILGEITAGIAHELNTPLANILGFAELLDNSLQDARNRRDLEKIRDSAIYCREVVKKLMFFACEMPQNMNYQELGPILENVLKLLGPTLRDKNIQVKKSLPEPIPAIKADTIQLTQVLFNLIMNAIYYSPVSGTIGVSILNSTRGITIEIADEGSGINQKIADKIFEPFFTTKPLGEGSGLGLSVVHGIMASHKGSISHRTNRSKGTVFVINFPK